MLHKAIGCLQQLKGLLKKWTGYSKFIHRIPYFYTKINSIRLYYICIPRQGQFLHLRYPCLKQNFKNWEYNMMNDSMNPHGAICNFMVYSIHFSRGPWTIWLAWFMARPLTQTTKFRGVEKSRLTSFQSKFSSTKFKTTS